eukprot:scaffold200404_cov30-Cyclotella_meneghiniana.AAC.1
MAHLLISLNGHRFQFSHQFGHLLVSQLNAELEDEETLCRVKPIKVIGETQTRARRFVNPTKPSILTPVANNKPNKKAPTRVHVMVPPAMKSSSDESSCSSSSCSISSHGDSFNNNPDSNDDVD